MDIGTSYIKVAQITHGSSRVLDTFGLVNVSSHIDSKSGQAAINDTAKIIRSLLDQARVSTKRCVASLPNSAVFTSLIDMPQMPEEELSAAMEFEAKKYIPLPFSEVKLSWSVISEAPDRKSIKVLLIAVPIQIRETYVKVFEHAGLDLEIIEIEALALIRSLVVESTKNSVIIDIGAKSTGIDIIKGDLLQLTRNLSIGGDTITERIAEALNLSLPRADQFKKDLGISKKEFLPDVVKPVLDSIKNEVRQLLTIYQSHNLVVENIILVGGGR